MKNSISLFLVFILICATIWLAFSIIVVTDLHPALPNLPVYRLIMSGLSFLSALFLFFLFFLLRSRNKIGYFLTIAFLLFIALLTIMDDLGVIDLVVLLITLLPVVLLIKDRNWYLHNSS